MLYIFTNIVLSRNCERFCILQVMITSAVLYISSLLLSL